MAARSPTCTPTSRATASSSQSGLQRTLAAIGEGEEPTAFEIVPRVYGPEPLSRSRAVAAHRNARHAAATSRPRAARGASPASPSAGPARALRDRRADGCAALPWRAGRIRSVDAHRRDPQRRRARVLVRVLPAQDGGRRAQPVRRSGRAAHAGAVVRVGHLRGGGLHAGRRRSRSSSASETSTGSRRWPTSPASARPCPSCARRSTRCSAAGIDNVLALRGDPPARAGGLDQDRGRPRVLARTGRADRAPTTRSRSAPPASRRPTSMPRAPRRIWSTSPRRSARAWTS